MTAEASKAMFFTKLTISPIFIIWSLTVQKLCMIKVAGIKKITRAMIPTDGL